VRGSAQPPLSIPGFWLSHSSVRFWPWTTEVLPRNHCTADRQMAYGISLLSHMKLTPEMHSYSFQSSGVYENRKLSRAEFNQLSSGFNSERDFLFLTPKTIHGVGHSIFSAFHIEEQAHWTRPSS